MFRFDPSFSPRRGLILLGFFCGFLLSFTASPVLALDDHNPIGVTGAFEGIITTGCAYNVLNHNASRQIDDVVVPGSIGKYPLKMTRYYNSRSTAAYGGLGPGWSHEYQWSSSSRDQKVEYPNGNVWDVGCFPDGGTPLGVSDGWQTLTLGQNGLTGDFRLADGGTVHFQPSNAGGTWHTVVTTIKDPYNKTTAITYDGTSGLLSRVTEPGGRYLQFTYTQINGQSFLHEVDAYDGQGHLIDSVVYNYASKPTGGRIVTSAICLVSASYGDGTSATYTYEPDNVPERPDLGSIKFLPLVSTCSDVRYHGPMRRIAYDYQGSGPHGAILKERYSPSDGVKGLMVSQIDPASPSPIIDDPNFDRTYTEIRGDGNVPRTFTYTDLHLTRSHGEPEVCPIAFLGPAPQQFLLNYSDFQNHTTWLHYDSNWYVDRVTDGKHTVVKRCESHGLPCDDTMNPPASRTAARSPRSLCSFTSQSR
jgi:Domain of unknown function (DUF6531)